LSGLPLQFSGTYQFNAYLATTKTQANALFSSLHKGCGPISPEIVNNILDILETKTQANALIYNNLRDPIIKQTIAVY
jgi:hypothetical protein